MRRMSRCKAASQLFDLEVKVLSEDGTMAIAVGVGGGANRAFREGWTREQWVDYAKFVWDMLERDHLAAERIARSKNTKT